MKQEDIVRPQGKLGVDLPDSEEGLFKLADYPLFDMELAADILGSEHLVKTVLVSLDKHIEPDLEKIKENYTKRNWEEIQRLVHKTKSSAEFGTVRLYFSLLFMERYLKAGYSRCQEDLYAQMLKIMAETLDELRNLGIIH